MSSASQSPSPEERPAHGFPESAEAAITDLPIGEPASQGSIIWQRVQLARHPKRPHSLDYISRIFDGFDELHGDRTFGDDAALVAGLADFEGRPVGVIGQQKGRDTKQKLYRNFGMPKPEGYRKALRVMKLAAKFGLPIITLIDTPGAYPGMDAEERGQAEAIAVNLREMARLPSPVLTVVIGEGGSGGALAIGVGNDNSMMENATYSVISPESCAAIIYRDAKKAELAAEALRVTAPELLALQLIDRVIPEPGEGAQTDWDAAAVALRNHVRGALHSFDGWTREQLISQRQEKFRRIASFFGDAKA
ncbi:MAG: acetyl-CoA carboxylase carboxyltransferase subunit alpha [Bryobacterales bacterium]|nr:acetyl-CoA carboxylase carboxyltransferase subunit alpha [Bryobacterales bacterium]